MSRFSEKREESEIATRRGPRWIWMGSALAAVVIAWGAYYFLYYRRPASALDDFAKCVTANSAKMYGAWWCPHCADQKDLFGSAFKYVNYVECSPPGERTINDVCKQAGIKTFPTWQFAGGPRKEGTEPLGMLARETGCKLP
jgi:hypothetical protein